jgi:glycosyltransferase involved in cell wall biosynthesis
VSLPATVIICTRDRPSLLDGCLAALAPQLGDADEAVVVDSASRDGRAVAEVAAAYGFRVVRADRPGLSVARNHGLAASSNPVVLFTDDDCRADEGWVARCASSFGDDRLGFLTGAVRVDRQTRLPLSVSGAETTPEADAAEHGHGANMSFRRAALDAVGGFDEALGAGGPLRAAEDKDIFWRLARAGWQGTFDPLASVTHVQWRNMTTALRVSFGYGIGAGALTVKRSRLGDRDGWSDLVALVGRRGFGQSWRDLRAGYQSGAAAAAAQAAGAIVGAVRGGRRPIDGSLYRAVSGRGRPLSCRTLTR